MLPGFQIGPWRFREVWPRDRAVGMGCRQHPRPGLGQRQTWSCLLERTPLPPEAEANVELVPNSVPGPILGLPPKLRGDQPPGSPVLTVD